MLDAFKKEEEEEEEEVDGGVERRALNISAASTPEVLEDLPEDFALLVGNALNNSALCQLKLKVNLLIYR